MRDTIIFDIRSISLSTLTENSLTENLASDKVVGIGTPSISVLPVTVIIVNVPKPDSKMLIVFPGTIPSAPKSTLADVTTVEPAVVDKSLFVIDLSGTVPTTISGLTVLNLSVDEAFGLPPYRKIFGLSRPSTKICISSLRS